MAIYNNSINALERAVKERVLYIQVNGIFVPKPVPTSIEFNSTIGDFVEQMGKLSTYSIPMTADAFALSYQDRRRGTYLRAAEQNRIFGFNNKLADVKAFAKCEKYNFTTKEPVPRIIQPRDPRYLSESGRYVKSVEKKIYKNINKLFGYTVVYKGLNAKQRATSLHNVWSTFRNPVAIPLDAARFDQRVSVPALELDHKIITQFFPFDKHIRHVLSLQLNNKCKARCDDGYLSYKVRGNRMSGDSNTSCGNVVICCAIMYGFIQGKTYRVCLANDGDDCIAVIEEDNLDDFVGSVGTHFDLAGFTMKLEKPVSIFEEISFCSSQPVLGNEGYIMVRDPRVAIAKDCVAIKPLDNKSVKEMWLCAVGKGGLSLTMGIPIWQDLYDMFVRESNGAKALCDPTLETGFFRLSQGMFLTNRVVLPETRFSFWKAFGISPSEQICMEDHYRNYKIDVGCHMNRYGTLPLYGHVQ